MCVDHRARGVGVEAADRGVVDRFELGEAERPLRRRRVHVADLSHVRDDLDAERAQELLADRAAGHARGGFARARALEHVAHVGEAVLPDPCEVRVPGPRQVDLLDRRRDRPRAHPLLPVGVVAVLDPQRDGPTERAAMAHAAGRLGAIALDLHPPAAPVPELAPRHVAVDRVAIERETRREALRRCR